MQRILTAVFNNRPAAEAAIADLLQAGFGRDDIHLGTGDPTGGDSVLTGAGDADAGQSGGVGNFLHSLFGTDNSQYAQQIDGAVTHSHFVLTLMTDDARAAGRAVDMVLAHGPVDVDSAAGAAPARAVPATLSQLNAEPPGTLADHEASWRAHHAQLSGEHYDEYAPAYLYGLDMATHEQHGGKEWEEAEAQLRSEWQRRHPRSAWSKFRAAVRHARERMRGG
jgi:hypothetical protein